ncbi:MAG: hypothetical protein PHD37_06080 [Gallionellaceae bacterium]|nr:hypothetical protein [Gallionellaceae bacterium]
MPERPRVAIARHHAPELFFSQADSEVKSLVALSHPVARVESLTTRNQDDNEWNRFLDATLAWLMLGDEYMHEPAQETASILLEYTL